MTKTDLAIQYRKKYGVEMPTLKLARIMYKENNLLFTDVESARRILRHIEGKSGAVDKKYLKNKEMVVEQERPRNPYNLPQSDEGVFEPFLIKGYERVGVLTDIHIPYHSIDTLTAAIGYFKKLKIDAILLNGDSIDCHTISRFIKDPKKRSFADEIKTFKEFIQILDKQLKCKIFMKLGNHEIRYEHFLYQKAHELVGIEEFKFENIVKAKEYGIDIIPDKQVMKLNSLNGIHGHEYIGGISAPVNTARGLYLRGKVSAFQGHTHQSSAHTETDMNGKVTTTWSVGCSCELHPEYMPLNKWNNGFAYVELDTNGEDFNFYNKTFIKGKIF